MLQPKPIAEPAVELDAAAPLPTDDPDAELPLAISAELPEAPVASSNAGKTPEQVAKEARIEALKNETLVYCGGNGLGDFLYEVTPYYAIFTVMLILGSTIGAKRRTERTSWRSWIRGRF